MCSKRMSEMLKLSAEVHKKIIRRIVPEATDEQVDFVVYNYPQINPFYYPHWRDGIKESFEEESSDEIDKLYERVARLVTDLPNILETVIAVEIDIFGRDEDLDLLDYYIIKYVRTHMHAVNMVRKFLKVKAYEERQMFKNTLKAWVGLFVSDKSIAEHYNQIISHTLRSFSIHEKPKPEEFKPQFGIYYDSDSEEDIPDD